MGGYRTDVDCDPLKSFDPSKPNIARAYDYMLGGKDNFAADRELAARMLEVFPLAASLVRESRAFLTRAVDYVASQGISQFIDVGSGMPTSPNTHETAGPDARVVYVDNDPVVISHASALLARKGSVAAVAGDIRQPDAVLASTALRSVIDLDEPVCVIMAMILHFLEPDEAGRVVDRFVRALAPGSFLIVSIGTRNDEALADQVISTYNAGNLHVHERSQIAGYFTGLELVEPGLTEVRNWLTVGPDTEAPGRPIELLAGIGHKAA
jgi:O-methyltransferase involved in polyketide biosynthesis